MSLCIIRHQLPHPPKRNLRSNWPLRKNLFEWTSIYPGHVSNVITQTYKLEEHVWSWRHQPADSSMVQFPPPPRALKNTQNNAQNACCSKKYPQEIPSGVTAEAWAEGGLTVNQFSHIATSTPRGSVCKPQLSTHPEEQIKFRVGSMRELATQNNAPIIATNNQRSHADCVHLFI